MIGVEARCRIVRTARPDIYPHTLASVPRTVEGEEVGTGELKARTWLLRPVCVVGFHKVQREPCSPSFQPPNTLAYISVASSKNMHLEALGAQ